MRKHRLSLGTQEIATGNTAGTAALVFWCSALPLFSRLPHAGVVSGRGMSPEPDDPNPPTAGLVYLYELSRTSPYLCAPWFSHLLEGHEDVLTCTELCGEEPSQQKWKSVEKYKTLNIFSKCFDGLSLVFWAWTGVTVRANSALVLVVPLFLSAPTHPLTKTAKWI